MRSHTLAPQSRFNTAVVSASILAASLVACSGAEGDPVAQNESAIINGDPIVFENIGIGLMLGPGGGCSATILTPKWVLTAQHCTPYDPAGTTVTWVSMGQTRSVVQTLTYPNVNWLTDVGLLRVDPPFDIPVDSTGHANQLWPGPAQEIVGKTVTCYGYGVNTDDGAGFGQLRVANLSVAALDVNNTYIMTMNARGQIQSYGDSGSPCFYSSGGTTYQVSVLSGAGIGSYGRQSSSVVASFVRPWVELQLFPSCTDHVQSGDEEGVDCGGSCSPCPPAATLNIFSDWNTGYCARASVTNYTGFTKHAWQINFDLRDSQMYENSYWNAALTKPDASAPSLFTAKNLAWNGELRSLETLNPDRSFGYCAAKTGPNWRPVVVSSAVKNY